MNTLIIKNKNKIVLFALQNSQIIGNKIANILNLPLTKIKKTVFADGEMMLVSQDSVRAKDIYIVCSATKPVNDSIFEILIFIDSLKRASPKSINVIMTYYGYARQDRKASGRQPITAKLMADLLSVAGISRLITFDLHNPSIQGFFDVPVDDLRAQYILANFINKQHKYVVVAPDHGGTTRSALLGQLIGHNTKLAVIDKTRIAKNQTIANGILGNVNNYDCIIVDDLIDTGGTIIKAAKAIKHAGGKKIFVVATHGLFSSGFQKFENCPYIDKVFITDTLEHVYSIKSKKIVIVSLAKFIAQVIVNTYSARSISEIYYYMHDKLKKLFKK